MTSSFATTSDMLERINSTTADQVRGMLLAELLQRFGRARLCVTGTSMLPSLWPGDMVEVVRCDPSALRRRDVILVQRDARLFCHRVVTLSRVDGRLRLRTQGDHLTQQDPAIDEASVLGKVVSVQRARSLPCAWLLTSRPAGFLLRHSARISGRTSGWLLRWARCSA